MKRPRFRSASEPAETDSDEQIKEAVTDAIMESNDKAVEIRPANESKGGKMFPLMLLVGGAVAVGYWLRKSRKPTEKLRSAANETADRTKQMTGQAAETIEESGETMAERVEEGSQRAGEGIQQSGEAAAETTEEAGEKAAGTVDESGSGSSSS